MVGPIDQESAGGPVVARGGRLVVSAGAERLGCAEIDERQWVQSPAYQS